MIFRRVIPEAFCTVTGLGCGIMPEEKPSPSISFIACGKEQFWMRMTRSTTLPWLLSPKSYQRFSFLKTLKLGELSQRKGERYMSYPPYRREGS
jgi:hypothetical protein